MLAAKRRRRRNKNKQKNLHGSEPKKQIEKVPDAKQKVADALRAAESARVSHCLVSTSSCTVSIFVSIFISATFSSAHIFVNAHLQ
jgi:hypothetical protein